MRSKLKIVIILSIIIFLLFIVSISTYLIDSHRIENNQPPIFILHTNRYDDGGTISYFGFGYQLIKWKRSASEDDYSKGIEFLVGIEKHYLFGIRGYVDEPQVELEPMSNM